MIEDLKKLLPREKEEWKVEELNSQTISGRVEGWNSCLAEVTAYLPSLVEYIYADLRERIAKAEVKTGNIEAQIGADAFKRFIIKLLTPKE